MAGYRHIVAALDLSPATAQVLSRARELARDWGARLTLVHVFEYLPPIDLADSPLGSIGWAVDEEALRELHQQRLRELAEREDLGDAERVLLTGLAREEIVRHAEEKAADLIVIGSHGRRGIARLLGSTANGVMHHAGCDVLAVRIRGN
jgi:universal stress protein A